MHKPTLISSYGYIEKTALERLCSGLKRVRDGYKTGKTVIERVENGYRTGRKRLNGLKRI